MKHLVGLLLAAGMLLGGCAAAPRRPVMAAAPAASGYLVRSGDTLYSIAKQLGLDYHDLARWNGLGRDFTIHVGERLVLAPAAAPSAAPPARAPELPVPPLFTWPAEGRIAGVIDRPAGGFGLRIDGALGAPVRAAAAGRVVYCGNGLRAYGLLVIIRHDDHYLTAYGHNQSATVTEGSDVASGQPIGTMGAGAEGAPMLYFEIRRDGRPINPLLALPALHQAVGDGSAEDQPRISASATRRSSATSRL